MVSPYDWRTQLFDGFRHPAQKQFSWGILGMLGSWPRPVCMGTRNIPWTMLTMRSTENLCYLNSEGKGQAL